MRKIRKSKAAFSLVEVTLAIGIVGFAFTAVFGLIPVGMSNFRDAMNTSVSAQIFQRVANDIMQTDWFSTKTGSTTTVAGIVNSTWTAAQAQQNANNGTLTYYEMVWPDASGSPNAIRYFDDQGNELQPKDSASAIYHVHAVSCNPAPLPGTANAAFTARIIVEVSNNPSNQTGSSNSTTKLWVKQPGEVITQYALFVGKNQ